MTPLGSNSGIVGPGPSKGMYQLQLELTGRPGWMDSSLCLLPFSPCLGGWVGGCGWVGGGLRAVPGGSVGAGGI